MKAAFIQPGNTIDYKNAGTGPIKYGSIVKLGADRIGIAASDIPVGELGALHLCGVFSCKKASGAVTLGAKLYYSEADDAVTTANSTPGEGEGAASTPNTPVGWAVAAAAAGDADVLVKLNG